MWHAENCIVVAEGVLQHSGVFKVRALGFPPVEFRGESLQAAKVRLRSMLEQTRTLLHLPYSAGANPSDPLISGNF